MGVVPCQMEGFFPTDEIMIELLKAVDRKKGIHDEFIKMKDYKELLENNPFAVIDALRDVKNLYFLTGFTGTLTEINTQKQDRLNAFISAIGLFFYIFSQLN